MTSAAVQTPGSNAPAAENLMHYLERVRRAIESQVPMAWVRFEIASFSGNPDPNAGGHLYLELIEKDATGASVAKARAALWGGKREMLQRFHRETGLKLTAGMALLGKISCNFKPNYGLTLILEDLDPAFTLGEAERRLRELRQRLHAEGLAELNRTLPLPSDFSHVAVIAPQNAAGLGDFNTIATGLSRHGLCQFHHFNAVFQGDNLYSTMRTAFLAAFEVHKQLLATGQRLDALVIIRGGGDTNGLNELNRYDVARLACRFPVPVLVGIGHERDNTILDEVACLRCATPSMAAAHIQEAIVTMAQEAGQMHTLAMQRSAQLSHMAWQHLSNVKLSVGNLTSELLFSAQHVLTGSQHQFGAAASSVCDQQRQLLGHHLQHIEQQGVAIATQSQFMLQRNQLQLLQDAGIALKQGRNWHRQSAQELLINNPLAILARGYAFVQNDRGELITRTAQVQPGDEVTILVEHGTIHAKVMSQENQDEQ
ncbi:Exodeoxyribonuclease 7 large subunit [compost metagenome]